MVVGRFVLPEERDRFRRPADILHSLRDADEVDATRVRQP
jgi:hypothetical protein